MAIWTHYAIKENPENEDTLMVYDEIGNENKQVKISDLSKKIVNDATEKQLDINTQNKTIPGAFNELYQKTEDIITGEQIVKEAEMVNGHTVNSDVPENAIFTDTVYDDTQVREDIGQLKEDIATETTAREEDIKKLSQSKISKFYASNQGETHITDSDDGSMADMKLYGRSEQKQYSGKNLLSIEAQKVVIDKNSNGYPLGKPDISVSQIPSGDYIFYFKASGYTSGQYLIAVTYNDGEKIQFNPGNSLTAVNKRSCTFSKDVSNISFYVNTACTIEDVMIVKTDTEDFTYEPYVGGQPSPSPDYPQEIKSVVNPTVKLVGKNLLNATLQTTTQNGVTCTNNGDGTYTLNGIATALIDMNLSVNFHIENGKTYRITGWVKNVLGFIYVINEKYDARDTGDGATFTYNGATTDSKVVHIQIPANAVINNAIIKPMICTDTSATYDDFEPYHEQTVTLPYTLNAIPVESGSNVTIDGQQYIADYVDVERGKLVRRVCRKVLRNANGYNLIRDNNLFFWDISEYAAGNNGYCNCYIANGVLEDKHVRFDNRKIYIKDDSITSLTDFNNKYSEKGLEFAYALATPTETDLTPEEIATFKALATYYPVTNISVNSEQLDGYTVFNYPVSMENGWNYVKQQIGDTRDYIYDMDARTQDTDLQAAEAYVNSEYAVALTELEV